MSDKTVPSHISADDLDVVNRSVYAVMRRVDELVERSDARISYLMSESSEEGGKLFRSDVSEMVDYDLSHRVPALHRSHQEPGVSDYGPFSIGWYRMYRNAVLWIVLGALYRRSAMFDMGGSDEMYHMSEMALRYEMGAVNLFARWNQKALLNRMSGPGYTPEPPALSE